MSQQNPYSVSPTPSLAEDRAAIWGHDVPARAEHRGVLRRRIQILVPVVATLEYRGDRLYDQVFVNNQLVDSRLPIFWFHEQFKFDFVVDQVSHSARIELKVGRFLQLKQFQLWVDGQRVYAESRGQIERLELERNHQ